MIAFLTFFATTSLGLLMSINSALSNLSDELGRTGIVQAVPGSNPDVARKIISDNRAMIIKNREINMTESKALLSRWLPSADAIEKYIPLMFEIETKTTDGLSNIAAAMQAQNFRFIHSANAGPERRTGIFIMLVSGLIFAVVILSMIFGIIHATKNIIMLHRREIEILSNVGATPRFIAWQIEMRMARIGIGAIILGQTSASAILLGINYISRVSRVGLLANMNMTIGHYCVTIIMVVIIMALVAYITGRTTFKVLNE